MNRARVAAPAVAAPRLSEAELSIARSVVYASLFDYPLTLAQLRETLLQSVQTPSEILASYERSAELQRLIEHRDGFFFPRGHSHLPGERRRREARSRAFLAHHGRLLALVCALPYVRLVALSGSIAHLNLEGGGDLDLFVVTRGRRVWSTTVAIILLAKLMRRRSGVCANFVIADSRLALDPQDLFTASQIIHLKPLVGRSVLGQLVAANPFVARYYPNFHSTDASVVPFRQPRAVAAAKRLVEVICAPPWWAVERLCHVSYRAHLGRRAAAWRSPDQVRLEPDCLKLHTQSHRGSVLKRFDQAMRKLLAKE
jgi:hypothetical protein